MGQKGSLLSTYLLKIKILSCPYAAFGLCYQNRHANQMPTGKYDYIINYGKGPTLLWHFHFNREYTVSLLCPWPLSIRSHSVMDA
jgi:hypothetical protein